MTRNEYMEMLEDANRIVDKYGYGAKTVNPYSFSMKISDILGECGEYEKCTRSTRRYLEDMLKGLYDILKAWEKTEESKTWVMYKGERRFMSKELIKNLTDCGYEVTLL